MGQVLGDKVELEGSEVPFASELLVVVLRGFLDGDVG